MAFDKNKFLAPSSIAGPFGVDGFGDVYVREVPCGEASIVYDAQGESAIEVSLRIVAVSLCDEHGERLFGDVDLDELRKVPPMRIESLIDLANKHSGFGSSPDDQVGNSPTTT